MALNICTLVLEGPKSEIHSGFARKRYKSLYVFVKNIQKCIGFCFCQKHTNIRKHFRAKLLWFSDLGPLKTPVYKFSGQNSVVRLLDKYLYCINCLANQIDLIEWARLCHSELYSIHYELQISYTSQKYTARANCNSSSVLVLLLINIVDNWLPWQKMRNFTINLCTLHTCLICTKILAPRVCKLHRFYCNCKIFDRLICIW